MKKYILIKEENKIKEETVSKEEVITENKEKMKGKRHICKHTGMSLSASNLFIICKKYQLG